MSTLKLYGIVFLMLLFSSDIAFAQFTFDPPEDFIEDVPEQEVKSGHVYWIKKFYGECWSGDSSNPVKENCTRVLQTKKIVIPYSIRMEDISWVKSFKNLEELYAPYNFIKVLPDTFPAKLKHINLANNNIACLTPGDFGVLPQKLISLNVAYQRGEDFTSLPVLPDSLQILYAGSNEITLLPDSLPVNLKKVQLDRNDFTSLDLSDIQNLEYLNVSYCAGLSSIVTDNDTLPEKLVSLYAGYCSLNSLPELNDSLQELYLQNNSFSSLPELTENLKHINISGNLFSDISGLGLPASLESFNASGNSISSLPEWSETGLRSINISDNVISSLPALPSTLLSLNIANNNIASLELSGVPSLYYLNADGNSLSGNLTELPVTIGELYIANNSVASFNQLPNLVALDCSENNLQELPFTELPSSLSRLYCQKNNISSIPNLPDNLRYLKASGNLFTCIPNLPKKLSSTDISIVCGRNCWKGGSGDWTNAANWTQGLPAAGENVLILSGTVHLSEDKSIKALDIRSAGIFGNGVLTITDSVYNVNSIIANLKLDGTANQIVESVSNFNSEVSYNYARYDSLIVSNPNGVVLKGTETLKVLGVEEGYLDLDGEQEKVISRLSICTGTNAIRNGTITYRVSVQPGWTFLGTIMKDQTLENLEESVKLGFGGATQSIYSYNGTTNENFGWVAPEGTSSSFTVGQGYRVYVHTSGIVEFTGVPFTGTKDLGVTFDEAGYDNGGWNLVSNPYLSTIDWNSAGWKKKNINNAIYVYDPSKKSYAAYVGGVGQNGGSNLIAAGQAFFVNANATGAVLEVSESAKSFERTNFLRLGAPEPLLKVYLNGPDSKTDELVVRIKETSTQGFDGEFDALKKYGYEHNLGIIGDDGKNLAISSIPQAADSYPLSLYTSRTGNFTLTFRGIDSFEGVNIFLVDEQTGKQVLLSNETVYEFEMTSTSAAGRFRLSFNPVITKVSHSDKTDPVSVYPNPATDFVKVRLLDENTSEIKLLNPLGEEVFQSSDIRGRMLQLPLQGGRGIYMLKVRVESKTHVYKIVKL